MSRRRMRKTQFIDSIIIALVDAGPHIRPSCSIFQPFLTFCCNLTATTSPFQLPVREEPAAVVLQARSERQRHQQQQQLQPGIRQPILDLLQLPLLLAEPAVPTAAATLSVQAEAASQGLDEADMIQYKCVNIHRRQAT